MIISAHQVTKIFNGVKALDQVSLSIESNKITGLIGRNGAGKTTLLKLIAGYLYTTKGDLKVFGKRPFNQLSVSEKVIFVHEAMNFPELLTLGEILSFGEKFYPNWEKGFAERLLEYFSINPVQTYPELSKGKRQVFHAIFGLSTRCPLTLFDEPTNGMDLATRKDFYRLILKDYMHHPRSIIISSHYLNEMEDLMEDLLLLHEGRKVLHLPMDEVSHYALGITGNRKSLEQIFRAEDILYERTFADDQTYLVVRNREIYDELKQNDQEITLVSPTDLAVYLTKDQKGGIDDVLSTHSTDANY